MNISLTPELEQFVSRKVNSGLYQTASEVVREGLRLLRERDELHQTKLEELRKEIALGIAEADRGKVGPVNAKGTLAKIRAKREAQAGTKN
jgi:antitoxin ParD1/3/4